MLLNNANSFYTIEPLSRVRQGDIYKDVTSLQSIDELESELDTRSLNMRYSVVISQDCDLLQDYHNRHTIAQNNNSASDHDKCLLSILLCPAYLFESFMVGEHLLDLDLRMQRFGSKQRDKLEKNEKYRYQHLPADQKLNIPALMLDFKHYITLPRNIFYSDKQDKYVATINVPFRERISQRFCDYLGRIGLPDSE